MDEMSTFAPFKFRDSYDSSVERKFYQSRTKFLRLCLRFYSNLHFFTGTTKPGRLGGHGPHIFIDPT